MWIFKVLVLSIILSGCTETISCHPDILLNGNLKNPDGSINIDMEHLEPGIKCKF